MSSTVVQQTLIEHNNLWRQRNTALLAKAEQQSVQGHCWEATVLLAQYDESEVRRLQIWASTLRAYPELQEQPT